MSRLMLLKITRCVRTLRKVMRNPDRDKQRNHHPLSLKKQILRCLTVHNNRLVLNNPVVLSSLMTCRCHRIHFPVLKRRRPATWKNISEVIKKKNTDYPHPTPIPNDLCCIRMYILYLCRTGITFFPTIHTLPAVSYRPTQKCLIC